MILTWNYLVQTSVPLPGTGAQHPILLSVNTDILDNGNESSVVLLGFANTRTEDLQEVAAENARCGDGGMDFSGRRERLGSRNWSRHTMTCRWLVYFLYRKWSLIGTHLWGRRGYWHGFRKVEAKDLRRGTLAECHREKPRG